MNREIKFRVWDKSLNKFLITDNGTSAVEPDSDEEFLRKELFSNRKLGEKYGFISFYPDRLIYQQFTGLKDKNNKDVYEGDVVKISYERYGQIEEKFIGKVKFGKCCVSDTSEAPQDSTIGFFIELNKNEKENRQMGLFPDHNLINGVANLEVIGNTMENPELLKQ